MNIMNREINMFNSSCDMYLLYNINSMLSFLIDGSWSIRYLEAKFLKYGSEPLDQFGG